MQQEAQNHTKVVKSARKIIRTLEHHLNEQSCPHNVHEIFAEAFEFDDLDE